MQLMQSSFVQSSLVGEVDYVRELLPEFPADWYKHNWAVARPREKIAENRERFSGADR